MQSPKTCFLCNSSSFCAACKTGNFLDLTNQCIENCGVRLFVNLAALKCQSCPYDCYSCDSSGSCLSCNSTNDFRILNQNSKRCVPLSGFYESYISISALLLVPHALLLAYLQLSAPHADKTASWISTLAVSLPVPSASSKTCKLGVVLSVLMTAWPVIPTTIKTALLAVLLTWEPFLQIDALLMLATMTA